MIQNSLFSTSAPLTVHKLRDKAEAKKQRGMALAGGARAEAVAAGQVAFLRSLLGSPDGTATIDDATTDLAHRFDGGGKWRGTVCRSLSLAGITEKAGVVMSDRPSRHRGYLTRWRLIDRNKAQQEIGRLTAWLSAIEKENPLSGATDAGDLKSNNTNSNTNGANENASF